MLEYCLYHKYAQFCTSSLKRPHQMGSVEARAKWCSYLLRHIFTKIEGARPFNHTCPRADATSGASTLLCAIYIRKNSIGQLNGDGQEHFCYGCWGWRGWFGRYHTLPAWVNYHQHFMSSHAWSRAHLLQHYCACLQLGGNFDYSS